MVLVAVEDGGGERDFLAIEFERSVKAAVELDLETSDDLSGWAPAWFATEITDPSVGENRERIRMVTDIPVEEHGERFLRLQIKTQ